jgi:hypothetical protein
MRLIDTGITLPHSRIAAQPCAADMADEERADLEHPFHAGLGNMPFAVDRSHGDANIGFCNDRFYAMSASAAGTFRRVVGR